MTNRPFFSIITPTYNRASFLEEMIASVTAQTFKDYEHIIIDDGSTDETETLITRLKNSHPQIIYIKQENKGRSIARNVGIEHAKGEYVCFLDSDDVWGDSKYLEELHKHSSEANFMATKMVWVNSVTNEKTFRPIEGFSHFKPQRIIEQEIGMNVCVKRSLFTGNLFNISLSINEDFELWTRIISATSTDVTAVPESHYLVTTPEIVGEVNNEALNGMAQAQVVMKRNEALNKKIPSSFWRQRTKGILLRRIRLYAEDGEKNNPVGSILKFLVLYPFEPVNKSLLVTLLYNLPGGKLLKSLVAKTKTKSVD